jgi:hypothetical protein
MALLENLIKDLLVNLIDQEFPGPAPGINNLLLETGSAYLLENGDFILLET